MPQRRYWNFKDDDATFDLNFRELGIFEPGRYRGFDAVLAAGLTLTLNHATTGADKTESDGATITRYGIWNSKQGTIVTEDADINLVIAAGDPTNPRIDLIVAQHQYIFSAGGAAAVYLVIQGTPAANPVAPALTVPAQQVILGQLYVPANMTDLNGAGVEYTQIPTPNYAGDNTIAHTDRTNNFEEIQIVKGLQEYCGQAFLDTALSSTTLFLKDFSGTDEDLDLNIYVLTATSVPANNAVINAIDNYPTVPAGQYRRITIFSPDISVRFAGGLFASRSVILKKGEAVTILVDNTGFAGFTEADEAALGAINRFQRLNMLNFDSNLPVFAGGLLTLSTFGNMLNIPNDGTNDLLRGISNTQNFDFGNGGIIQPGGGFVWLFPNGNFTMRLQDQDFTVPAGYKPIWNPTPMPPTAQGYFRVKSFAPLLFVEDQLFWRLVNPVNGWYDIPINLVVSSGPGSISVNLGSSELKVKISENSVYVRFFITYTTTGNVNEVLLDLQLPYNWPGLSQVALGSFSPSGGTLPKQVMFVESLTGSNLRLTDDQGDFQTGSNRSIQFSGTFELGT